MADNLLIVEHPTAARQISDWLGPGWRVEATRGPVRDLPAESLGIAVEDGFRPDFRVLPHQAATVRRLRRTMHAAEAVYFATGPGGTGELLSWHVLALADLPPDKPVHRIAFTAVTENDVRATLDAPHPLNLPLVEAELARQIVDRLAGYLVSAVASQALDGWNPVGRLPGVCLREIVAGEAGPALPAEHVRALRVRGYVRFHEGRLIPTQAGRRLADFLAAHFADLTSVSYSTRLDAAFEAVARGALSRPQVLAAFWEDFQPQLARAAASVPHPVTYRHLALPPRPLTLHRRVLSQEHEG